MNGRFVMVAALLTVSWMWPSEGAINGDGLHWAILWLAAAAYGCWQFLRSDDSRSSIEDGRRNLLSRSAPFVIVAGVWVSTAYVFQIQGDRRTALNIAFEWTAILAASVLFWQWPAALFRQQFGRLLVGLALGTAIMGILQHHVVWEQRANWYLERMAAVENWEQAGVGATTAKQAEAELLAEQVPMTGSAQETFRRRLLDSTEAIGPFALANTLGGFLAAGLVLLIGFMRSAFWASTSVPSKWKGAFLPAVWAVIIGYALVLTKSRTAWVATAVGVFWLLYGMRSGYNGSQLPAGKTNDVGEDEDKSRHSLGKAVLVICLVGGGLLVAGLAVGAIDREVLLESPRSLRFRLTYWMGTLDLLADRVLFGTGPGNFRNTYLQYKLPEASEQILDPHNLPLDTYCNAGLLGLAGLLLLLITAFASRTKGNAVRREADPCVELLQNNFRRGPFFVACGAAASLYATWDWFNGADVFAELLKLPDGGLLVLGIPAGIVLVTVTAVQRWNIDRTVFQAGFLTLLVHLMGAGAFQITAVGLVLMCLHRGCCDSFGSADNNESLSGNRAVNGLPAWSRFSTRAGVVGFSLLAVIVAVHGLIPVRAAQQASNASRMAEVSGRAEQAVAGLDKGILADEFDVKLRQRKAELLAYSFMAGIAVGGDFAQNADVGVQKSMAAIAACDEWNLTDTTGYRQFVVRSQVLESLWKLQRSRNLILSAISAMEQAVERYPTSAESLSRLAMLKNVAGLNRMAMATASSALKQDAINHNWGHVELYLDDSVVGLLKAMLEH